MRVLVARLTLACNTPGSRESARSTRLLHEAQVMPCTAKSHSRGRIDGSATVFMVQARCPGEACHVAGFAFRLGISVPVLVHPDRPMALP
jgi:hypothetical protein